MAKDDSDKSTGDPIRDAIIAQGKAANAAGEQERQALDELREHALARERELLRAKAAAQNTWLEGPSEDQFNNDWFTPLDALEVSDERMADDADKWSIVQQLQAGTIRAVARKAQVNPHLLVTEYLAVIFPGAWRRMDTNAELNFWKTGHLVVPAARADDYGHSTADKERYFDIKFDPASFSGKPLPQPPDERETKSEPTPPGAAELVRADAVQRNKGGRPSGKAGEPIAAVTIRLMRLSPEELAEQTAASLAMDLVEEYKRLGLVPPVLSNAEREAAGILRALRK